MNESVTAVLKPIQAAGSRVARNTALGFVLETITVLRCDKEYKEVLREYPRLDERTVSLPDWWWPVLCPRPVK